MTIEAERETAAPARRRRRRRNLWLLWVAAAAAAVVAAVALLGGFNEVPIEKLPVIELGETYSGNEVDASITGTYLTVQQPGQTFDADEGEQYFVVEATALNTTDSPDVLDRGLVRILLGEVVGPEVAPDGVVRGSGFGLDFLQPGLETPLLYFWIVPESVSEGDDVVVGVFERHLIDDPRYGGDVFSPGEPMARVITTIGADQ